MTEAPWTNPPRALVVAFDGLIADTHAARTLAVVDALAAEGTPTDAVYVASLVLGRSLDETVEAVLHAKAATSGTSIDHTTRDLTVLRARRNYSAIAAHGLPLLPGANAWIAALAARDTRVVLRADSARVDVELLLRLSGLGDTVAFTRCADDLPYTRGESSVRSAWQAISARCTALGLDLRACRALEASAEGVAAAQAHVADVRLTLSLRE